MSDGGIEQFRVRKKQKIPEEEAYLAEAASTSGLPAFNLQPKNQLTPKLVEIGARTRDKNESQEKAGGNVKTILVGGSGSRFDKAFEKERKSKAKATSGEKFVKLTYKPSREDLALSRDVGLRSGSPSTKRLSPVLQQEATSSTNEGGEGGSKADQLQVRLLNSLIRIRK